MILATNPNERPRIEDMLRCESCGNNDLFVQVMNYESHLVDGRLNYLHLLDSEVDHYVCHQCGNAVEPIALRIQ